VFSFGNEKARAAFTEDYGHNGCAYRAKENYEGFGCWAMATSARQNVLGIICRHEREGGVVA